MKAKDLMIGNLVNIYTFPNDNPSDNDLFPAKITSILTALPSEQFYESVECVFEAKDKEGGLGVASRPADTCLPIRITPEILVKNGFEQDKRDKNYYKWNWYVMEDNASYDTETGQLRIFKCGDLTYWHPISYVHELQNALRLCEVDKEIKLF